MEECIAKLLNTSSSDRQNLRHLLNDYFHESDEMEDSASDSDSNDSMKRLKISGTCYIAGSWHSFKFSAKPMSYCSSIKLIVYSFHYFT